MPFNDSTVYDNILHALGLDINEWNISYNRSCTVFDTATTFVTEEDKEVPTIRILYYYNEDEIFFIIYGDIQTKISDLDITAEERNTIVQALRVVEATQNASHNKDCVIELNYDNNDQFQQYLTDFDHSKPYQTRTDHEVFTKTLNTKIVGFVLEDEDHAFPAMWDKKTGKKINLFPPEPGEIHDLDLINMENGNERT